MTEVASGGAPPLSAAAPPLSFRRFRLLLGSVAVSSAGDALTSVALAFAVLDATGSASAVGIVMSSRLVPVVLLILLGGALADRGSKSRQMAVAQAVSALTQLSFAGLIVMGRPSLLALSAVYAIFGMSQAMFRPAASAVVRETVQVGSLQKANALLASVTNLSGLVGPVTGSLLMVVVAPSTAIAIDGGSFAVSALLLCGVRTPAAVRVERTSVRADIVAGFRLVVSTAWLRVMISYFGVFQFGVLGIFYVVGPVLSNSQYAGAAGWGLLLACAGAGGVVGSAVALKWQPRRPLVWSLAAAQLVLPSLLVIASDGPFVVACAAMLLHGAGMAVGGTLWETALLRGVPSDAVARVSAFDWLGSLTLRPLGLAMAGPLLLALSGGQVLVGVAVLTGCGGLLAMLHPQVRRVDSPHDARDAAADPAG